MERARVFRTSSPIQMRHCEIVGSLVSAVQHAALEPVVLTLSLPCSRTLATRKSAEGRRFLKRLPGRGI